MPMMCVVYRSRGTRPYKLTAQERKESKLYLGYDRTYTREYTAIDSDGEEYEKTETVEVTKESCLQDAIEMQSKLYYGSTNRDTWIVDEDGTVLAIISFI